MVILAHRTEQRIGQSIGNAHPGQHILLLAVFLQPIFTAGLLGIDHRERIRHLLAHRMVIGDDHIQAALVSVFNFLQRANTAVHCDHKVCTIVFQLAQCGTVEAIALVYPVWNIRLDVGTHCPQSQHQQRRTRHAVRVEVAIDDDLFALLDGFPNTLHSHTHAQHLERVAQFAFRTQEFFRCQMVSDPTMIEDSRQCAVHAPEGTVL